MVDDVQSAQPEISWRTNTAIRLPTVLQRTGFSRTHLYRLVRTGKFPAPRRLSARASGWSEAEVDAWLASKLGSAAHE